MTKTTTPNIDILNIHIVHHWILQVHSISCNVEIFYCLVTALTSLFCCKARLITNDFSLVCLHIINKTTLVTNNKNNSSNKKEKCLQCKIIKKGIFLSHF